MQSKVTDITVAKNSVNTVLQNQKALWKGVQDIDSSIANNERLLKKELASLENAEANIEIGRHWYGAVNIDTICESLTNVYDDLREYIQTCGSAIRTTNENLSHTLGLIRLLTMIEKDLYEQLDNESIQGNVLKELIKDWCKKNNIRDEEVNQLLETSFQRAYTLRDRINDIRGEVRNKFGYYDTELEKLSTNVDSLRSYISTEKEKALKELSKLYSVKEFMLDRYSIEKKNELARLHTKNVQASNELFHAIVAKTKELSQNIKVQREEVSKQNSEVKNALNRNLEEINAKQNQAIQKIENAINANNEVLQKVIQQISIEAHNKVVEYKDLCESSIKDLRSYKEQIEEEKRDYLLKVGSALNSMQEKLEQSLSEMTKASNEGKKKILELKEQIEAENKSTQFRIKEQIKSFEGIFRELMENQKKEHDSRMVSQQIMLSKVIEKANGMVKRWAIVGAIVGAGLAFAISYAVSMIL